jgi:hypothetical protein
MNNSSSPANITRNESNTSGGNLQFGGNAETTPHNAKENLNHEMIEVTTTPNTI